MNRRHYISILGTLGICSLGLGVAYQLEQGNISLGEDADISAEVSGSSETFEFEAAEDDEIYVTLTDTQDEPYRGAFSLRDPAGNEVLHGGLRTSETLSDAHTAQQGGSYRLVVDPRGGSLRVSVMITGPEE